MHACISCSPQRRATMQCCRLLKGLQPELSKAMAEVEKKEQVISPTASEWIHKAHAYLSCALCIFHIFKLNASARTIIKLQSDEAGTLPGQALLDTSDKKAEDQRRREAALRHIQDDYEARKLVQERQRLALQAAEAAAKAKADTQAAQRAAAQHEDSGEYEEEDE